VTTDTLPVSPLAKRASTFALLGLLVNIVSNMLTGWVLSVYMPTSISAQPDAGTGPIALLVVAKLVLVALIVFAVRYAVRALPQTATGSGYSGRGRVIATFLLCGLFVFALISAVVALFVLL
jgi:hypothetical protein